MKSVALALSLACFGCSWITTRPPRAGSECSENYVSPWIDASHAAGSALLAALALGEERDTEGLAAFMALTSAGQAVVAGLSARYGFENARLCRERNAQVTPATR